MLLSKRVDITIGSKPIVSIKLSVAGVPVIGHSVVLWGGSKTDASIYARRLGEGITESKGIDFVHVSTKDAFLEVSTSSGLELLIPVHPRLGEQVTIELDFTPLEWKGEETDDRVPED